MPHAGEWVKIWFVYAYTKKLNGDYGLQSGHMNRL